jgi:hypothetical protein
MHRKFIALILATALAITGLSAVPARADGDTARLLAGLAALALIGVAIQKKNKRRVVSRNQTVQPLPLPSRVTRFDLPQRCLRSRSVNGRQRTLFGARCLQKNYIQNRSLPNACRLGYWSGDRNRAGYDPQCLRERGYRFARQ